MNERLIVSFFYFGRVTQVNLTEFSQQPNEIGSIIILILQIRKKLRKILGHIANKQPCQALNLYLFDQPSCPNHLTILPLSLCLFSKWQYSICNKADSLRKRYSSILFGEIGMYCFKISLGGSRSLQSSPKQLAWQHA